LSQSAVSRQIQNLEVQLGTALFERQYKDIALTRAGIFKPIPFKVFPPQPF